MTTQRSAGGGGDWPEPNRPLLGIGQVRHSRARPVRNSFAYPTYFLMLPLRSLRAMPDPVLRRNRFGLISFSDRDHGDGREDALEWLDGLLASEGIVDALGETWLHCYPRVLGHTFKPVSFWYCHRRDHTLAAIVVEVNNTFGERHCYLLTGPELAFGHPLVADKVFHVSPFCRTAGRYRFRFMRNDVPPAAATGDKRPTRTVAVIDHDDDDGPLLHTSVSGALQPLTRRTACAAFFGMPLMTLGIVARIHWQALRLWCKRTPFFRKPHLPESFVTR